MTIKFIGQKTIVKMTRKKYPKVQARWFKKHGIPWTYNGDGGLNVLVDDYIKKFGLKDNKQRKKAEEPDLDAIREINGKKAAKKQTPTTKGAI